MSVLTRLSQGVYAPDTTSFDTHPYTSAEHAQTLSHARTRRTNRTEFDPSKTPNDRFSPATTTCQKSDT
jgi:hypothetical protein